MVVYFMLLWISIFQLCFTASYLYALPNDARQRYLLLRQMNYDFANSYKQHLRHAEQNELFDSQVKALQFRKKYSDYLLNLPTTNSLFDPNGYFANPQRFGFNPLQRELINNMYGSSQYIKDNSIAPVVFLKSDDNKSQALKIDTDQSPALPQSLSNLPNSIPFEQKTLNLGRDDLPSNAQQTLEARYQLGVKTTKDSSDLIKDEINDINTLIAKYEDLINLDSEPEHLILIHRKISDSLDITRQNIAILNNYSNRIINAVSNNGLNSGQLENIVTKLNQQDIFLDEQELRFNQINKSVGNPYTLITSSKMEEIFETDAILEEPVDFPSPENQLNLNNEPPAAEEDTPKSDIEVNTPTSNPLGPPMGSSSEDGTPPPDLNIDKLNLEQASEVRRLPSWMEGARKRWRGVANIISGRTMQLLSGGRRGSQRIKRGRALLREADSIQRAVLKLYFDEKNKVKVE
tara:strand:+ start:1200 stop:2585 length:1386 start_codon:yes stop_codon:yes gene_type:complete